LKWHTGATYPLLPAELFLCAPESGYLTSATISVNGGRLMV